MKKIILCFSLIAMTWMNVNCGGGSAASPTAPTPVDIGSSEAFGLVGAANNVVSVTLGSGCLVGGTSYQNEICVAVTVCRAGTASCTSVNKILLDTGSYGLRLFKSAPLTALTLGAVTTTAGDPAYNCATYFDGSGDWGPVKLADLTLGGLTASNVPIEIIDPTDATPSGNCDPSTGVTLDASASAAGFNGILGVGLFKEDCGSKCATDSTNGVYYGCQTVMGTTTCNGATVALASQVSNPVFSMGASYNNGIVMNLPNVAGLGASSATGQMILGIGTLANNTPTTSSQLTANSSGFFRTSYNGTTYTKAFIDSGSNALYFAGGLPICGDGEFFCPGSAQNLSAAMSGSNLAMQRTVAFQVYNTDTLLGTGNVVFNNFAGTESAPYFDWGLPVFMGRKIYVGYDGQTASFNTVSGGVTTPHSWLGPYWAL